MTGDEMALELSESRLVLGAPRRLHERTTGVESACDRRVRRARQIAFDTNRDPAFLNRGIRNRDCGQKRDRLRVERIVVKVVGGSNLYDLA